MSAIDNARAHLADIRRLHAAHQEAMQISDRLVEQIEEEARDQVLSLEVRTGWHCPSDPPSQPEQGCLTLTTGGPALRVLIELDCDAEVLECQLQHQDWGTPWIELPLTEADDEALCWFAGLFTYAVPQ